MDYKPFISPQVARAMTLAAFLICLFAATYKLSESPAIWYDEGYYMQAAQNLAFHGVQGLRVAPDRFVSSWTLTVGYPVIYPIALSYKLFGFGVLQGRAVMVLYILGFLTASFFFIRRLFGDWAAAWTILLIATLPLLYGNGKSILGEVPGLLYAVLALMALVKLEQSGYRSRAAYAALGLWVGIAFAAKISFGLLGLAVLLVWLINVRRIRLRWDGLALAALAALAAVLWWAATQLAPGELSSVIAFYLNPYAASATGEQFSILANLRLFVSDTTPLYTLIALSIWAAALYLRRGAVSIAEQVAYAFAAEITLSFLLLPGWYRYLFPATMIALLFLPASLLTVTDAFIAKMRMSGQVRMAAYVLIGLLSLGQAYQLAHGSYVASYYHSTRTRELAAYFDAFPATTTAFVYDAPEVAPFISSGNYYQFIHPTPQVPIDQDPDATGRENLPLLVRGVPEVVIVGTSFYRSHPDLFVRYREAAEVNRYSILAKK